MKDDAAQGMHVLVNLTWRCQLRCAYCWVHGLGIKPEQEMPPRLWLWFLRQLPGPMIVDFSGGEPLLYGGLCQIIEGLIGAGYGWAMTSNLVDTEKVNLLIDNRYGNCAGIHVSAHKGGPVDLYERAARLAKAGYPIVLNVVDHPAARQVPDGMTIALIPYQPWTEGEAVDGKARRCNAGKAHIVMAPDGRVYRCGVEMQVGAEALGHITQPWISMAPDEPHECRVGCSTCYTHEPRAWKIEMEPLA